MHKRIDNSSEREIKTVYKDRDQLKTEDWAHTVHGLKKKWMILINLHFLFTTIYIIISHTVQGNNSKCVVWGSCTNSILPSTVWPSLWIIKDLEGIFNDLSHIGIPCQIRFPHPLSIFNLWADILSLPPTANQLQRECLGWFFVINSLCMHWREYIYSRKKLSHSIKKRGFTH